MKNLASILGSRGLGPVGVAAILLSGGVQPLLAADVIPYPTPGVYNAVTYSFTATSTGDIMAYFAGSTAAYDNELGLLVNGVSTGVIGLDNHTSALGLSLDLGHANAGDVLTFVLQNNTLGRDAYSDPSMNVGYDSVGWTGGHNHIYSTAYTANPPIDSIPNGVYVAFEDLPFPGSDYNYHDETFVFTDVTASTAPDAASTLGLLGLACGGLGLLRRRLA